MVFAGGGSSWGVSVGTGRGVAVDSSTGIVVSSAGIIVGVGGGAVGIAVSQGKSNASPFLEIPP